MVMGSTDSFTGKMRAINVCMPVYTKLINGVIYFLPLSIHLKVLSYSTKWSAFVCSQLPQHPVPQHPPATFFPIRWKCLTSKIKDLITNNLSRQIYNWGRSQSSSGSRSQGHGLRIRMLPVWHFSPNVTIHIFEPLQDALPKRQCESARQYYRIWKRYWGGKMPYYYTMRVHCESKRRKQKHTGIFWKNDSIR